VFKSIQFRLAALALASTVAMGAQAADVTGAGASFVYPVMSKWSADYNKAAGKKVNYQSIGSGGGIAQIKAATVDFGSSDAPLKPEELAQAGLAQFPSVIGGVVPVVNVPGVASGALKLDGDTLANIFLGKITKWNDRRSSRSTAACSCRTARSPSYTARTVRAPRSTSSTISRRCRRTGSRRSVKARR
jgi:phosphate transport system substrate-binding protein